MQQGRGKELKIKLQNDWGSLGVELKEKYQQLAIQDKLRYEKEMENWVKRIKFSFYL